MANIQTPVCVEITNENPHISSPTATRNGDSPSLSPGTSIDGVNLNSSQHYLDSENARYHGMWDEQMKDKGGNGWLHEKTCVLLISWHESMDKLKVEDEVHRLDTTFTTLYNYNVTRRYIMPDKLAQVQLSKYVADFVYEFDNEKTLLIIYYAGHGLGGKPGQLVLVS